MSKWEVFFDRIYFDMFAVRPIGDKDFHSPRLFYFDSEEDANKCKEILDKCHCNMLNTEVISTNNKTKYCSKCKQETSTMNIILTEGPHYAKEVCKICGKYHKWLSHKEANKLS